MIIIIGTGAVASELGWFPFEIKGYLEYTGNIEKYWKHYQFEKPVLGDVDSYEICEDDQFVLGMTNIEFRKKMIEKIKSRGGRFINIIHPLAIVQKPLEIGEGNIIHPYCIIGANTKIGNFNHFCPQSIFGHDCTAGNNNIFSAVIVCGHVEIGNDNFFGIKSAVMSHIRIGDANGIHAGMTIDENISNHTLITKELNEKTVVVKNYFRK